MEFPKTLYVKIEKMEPQNVEDQSTWFHTEDEIEPLADEKPANIATYQLVEYGEYHIKSELVQGVMTHPGEGK